MSLLLLLFFFVDDLLYLVCPGEVIQPFVLSGSVLMVRTHHKEVAVSSIGAIASIFRGEEIPILGLFFLTNLPENLLEMFFSPYEGIPGWGRGWTFSFH